MKKKKKIKRYFKILIELKYTSWIKTTVFLLFFLPSSEPIQPVTEQKCKCKTDHSFSFIIMMYKTLFQGVSIYTISSQPKIK